MNIFNFYGQFIQHRHRDKFNANNYSLCLIDYYACLSVNQSLLVMISSNTMGLTFASIEQGLLMYKTLVNNFLQKSLKHEV